jgi:hypothetical protein
MEEQKKCECGMPLDKKSECSCEPGTCIYCCTCPDDCSCGCKKTEQEAVEE